MGEIRNNTALIQRAPNSWLLYNDPVHVVQVDSLPDVIPALKEVEDAAASGLFAAGFISYEAAPAFDPALSVRAGSEFPLLRFGLYPEVTELESPPDSEADYSVSEWVPDTSESEYNAAIEKIHDYIHAGDTYQVNYTMRLSSRFTGDSYSFFRKIQKSQGGRNCAYLKFGKYAVCSASPELFFALKGDAVKSCPMKGTMPRGMTLEEDRENMRALHESEKNRAENVMIVDMIRNDLGRVAEPGTVEVSRAFDVERYPTVLQMTSTVRGQTKSSLVEIMKAMFPCSSITGAPKVRTMEIIAELERGSRGLYTGAIGCIAPGGSRKALFNVAIRTVVIDEESAKAEYGVGGGIVWDSTARNEFEECVHKADVLTAVVPDFELLETMLWIPEDGFYLRDMHLDRMAASAEYFGIDFDREEVVSRLNEQEKRFASDRMRVRLLLDGKGGVSIESTVISERSKVWKICLSKKPVQSGNRFLYHKTTCRDVYEEAKNECPGYDDVVLYNERDEVTESTIANIVVRMDGEMLTPPVSSGLLAGVFRRKLLEDEGIRESVIKVSDLEKAESIYLVNSVRKWIETKYSPLTPVT